MAGRTSLTILTALVSVALATAQTQAPRTRTPAVLPIASITIAGNKLLQTDAILAAAGLKINGDGGPAIFDAARDRLIATGYFDNVSYTFRQQDAGFAIAFTIIENKHVFPLRIEGLPLTDAQLTQLLKSNNPLFNGLLPAAKPVLDHAASLVEQFLAATNPGLHVTAKGVPTGPERIEIQFAPAEGLPVIADVTFEGSAVVKDTELHTVMIENGIGQVFTESSVRNLLDRFIRPLFEKQGYMRVSFPKITSAPAEKVKGIDVHVTVADGPQFKSGAVSVRGPLSNDSRRILRIANLPHSDYANGDDITQAQTRIHDTLRGEGYLDVTVSTGRAINDAAKTVDFWFDIDPGPVYTFGHLEVLGLGLDGEAAIRKLWSVKPGDPFPGAYPDYFVTTLKQEDLFDNLGGITATPTINNQTHVVDVSLHFASAPTIQGNTDVLTAITRAVSASLASCELTWLEREPIDIAKAIAEHHAYERCLADLGARVISLPPLDAHPDAVFVEDPAIVLDEVAVITTMGCESRRGERETLAAAIATFRPLLYMQAPAKLEGGDVLRVGRRLCAGLSARTDAAGIAQLTELLAPWNYEVHAVELRNCLHLKSACCCIADDCILLNPEWLNAPPFKNYRLIEVAKSEPAAANALRVGDTILMPNAYPETAAILRRAGFPVIELEMTELMKAESGVTCSSLLFTTP